MYLSFGTTVISIDKVTLEEKHRFHTKFDTFQLCLFGEGYVLCGLDGGYIQIFTEADRSISDAQRVTERSFNDMVRTSIAGQYTLLPS